jgi:hypothetical protein
MSTEGPMTTDIATSPPASLPISRTPIEISTKTGRKLRMTRRVKAAIDAMVWQGLKRDEAAQFANLKDNSLYVALSKPDVRAYYLQQLDVLRTSERARNFHALVDVRDQTGNAMARVNAVKAMEQIEQVSDHVGVLGRAPGVTIVIAAPAQATAFIDHEGYNASKPLISLDAVPSVRPIGYGTGSDPRKPDQGGGGG